jgi:hypothetical protein
VTATFADGSNTTGRSPKFYFLIALTLAVALDITVKLPIILGNNSVFVGFYDREYYFVAIDILIREIKSHHLLLWSVPDQLPTAFLRIVGGTYAFDQIVAAIVLVTLDLVFGLKDSARYFIAYESVILVVYSVLKFLTCYYFLNSFVSRKASALGAMIFVVLMSTYLNLGFGFRFLYLLSFVLTGALVRLGRSVNTQNLGVVVAVAGAVVFTAPLFSFSYFYLGVHCFLLLAALIFFIFERNRGARFIEFLKSLAMAAWSKKIIPYAAFALVINLPYLALYGQIKSLSFGLETSRFATERNFLEYLKLPFSASKWQDFPLDTLSFHHPYWGHSWVLTGTLITVLVFSGIFRNSSRLKWIFLGQLMLFVLMNSAAKFEQPALWFHLINYLTNPLSFLGRSFHMTGSLMLFLPVMALVGMGLQSLLGSGSRPVDDLRREIIAYFIFFLWFALRHLWIYRLHEGVLPYIYPALPVVLYLACKYAPLSGKNLRNVFLAVLFIIDVPAFAHYLERTAADVTRYAQVTDDLALKIGLGEKYSSGFVSPFADIRLRHKAGMPVEGADPYNTETLYSGQAINRALVKGITFWTRTYFEASQYRPKHKSYEGLAGDSAFQREFAKNPVPVWQLDQTKTSDESYVSLLQGSVPTDWNFIDLTSSRFRARGSSSLSGDILLMLPFDRKMKIYAAGEELPSAPIANTFTKVHLAKAVSELSFEYDGKNPAYFGFPIAAGLYLVFWLGFLCRVCRDACRP